MIFFIKTPCTLSRDKDNKQINDILQPVETNQLKFDCSVVIMSSANIRVLNSDLQVIAREQLQEDPSKIQENLEAFREWIRKCPHLKPRTDDQFLIAFLRGCKYSLEKAKQKLDLFYTIRTHIPELIVNRDPLDEKMLAIIKLGIGLPMPVEHPGAPRLMLMRPGRFDAGKFTMQEIIKVSTMMNDILMVEDDNLTVAGQIAVIDLQGVTLQHLIQMQPSFVKKLTMMMQDSNPVRQKGIHYINAPKSFEHLYNLFKSFMNEKMRSRVS